MTLNFDLVNPKSHQFILDSRCTVDKSLVKFHLFLWEILCKNIILISRGIMKILNSKTHNSNDTNNEANKDASIL